jgi:hypothetical protein
VEPFFNVSCGRGRLPAIESILHKTIDVARPQIDSADSVPLLESLPSAKSTKSDLLKNGSRDDVGGDTVSLLP